MRFQNLHKEKVTREYEFKSTGSSPTNNKEFDNNGYLVLRNFWDSKDLYSDFPTETGIYNYDKKNPDRLKNVLTEVQVPGSVARYYYKQYRYYHSQFRRKIEKIIGKKLYETYYYERIYSPGQELEPHTDRDACEISLSFHIRTNLSTPWPFWIKTPDTYDNDDLKRRTKIVKEGEEHSAILNEGDAIVYKGCERPHWREPMPREYTKPSWFGKVIEKENLFYHQIFFHYVLSDGIRAHHAFDN